VDDATHTVIKSHQIAGWDDFPLADWITELLDLPTVLGNDADVAGLAEALHGAGKGLSPIFYITIGSGIGGGFIINGEVYRGCGRGAAEIGHLRWHDTHVDDYGHAMNTEDILEGTSSGWALARMADIRCWSGAGRGSLLLRLVDGESHFITAQDIAEAATQGDKLAHDILSNAWRRLAEAICSVITLLCPRRIVIGGGVSLMGELLLFEPLRRMVTERVFRPFAGLTDIVPAALGEEVVVHGAIALAHKRLAS
jgi:glucokinase